MAIMRAGVVHWHAGQIEEAHGLICKAYRILLATHGPNHAITKDLEVGSLGRTLQIGGILLKNKKKNPDLATGTWR